MDSYREKSEFNDAIGHLRRMDTYFYLCNTASANLDAHNWYQSLMVLYRELSNDMTKQEAEEADKLRKEIAQTINQRNTISATQKIRPDLYEKLNKFELLIRKIYKNGGYQGKSQDDPRYALK